MELSFPELWYGWVVETSSDQDFPLNCPPTQEVTHLCTDSCRSSCNFCHTLARLKSQFLARCNLMPGCVVSELWGWRLDTDE